VTEHYEVAGPVGVADVARADAGRRGAERENAGPR
jgi:hypothetical protein